MNKRKKHSTHRCPGCGKPLLQEGSFCYACCSLLDETGSRLLLPQEVSERALAALLEKSRAANEAKNSTLRSRIASKIGMLAMICMGGVVVLGLFFDQWMEWAVVLALVELVLFALSALVDGPEPKVALRPEQCRLLFARYIAPGVVNAVFGGDASYEPQGWMEEQLIPEDLFGWDAFDSYRGSQLIRAFWRGAPVEVCYAHVTRSRTVNGTKHIDDIFQGNFLYARTRIAVPVEIRITEKYFGVLHLPEEEALPEDFAKVFNVKCKDAGAAQAVLVPRLRRQLVELCKQCSGELHIVLEPGGYLFIAVGESGQEMTEDSDPVQLRQGYQRQLSVLIKVLDCVLEQE